MKRTPAIREASASRESAGRGVVTVGLMRRPRPGMDGSCEFDEDDIPFDSDLVDDVDVSDLRGLADVLGRSAAEMRAILRSER